jgi:FMN phosphatase YigB (HAD superfamily)
MAEPVHSKVVCLIDVDNTLLDNDTVIADLREYLAREVGPARADQYFEIFEERRQKLGYADYLGALQSYRDLYPRDPHVLAVSAFLINYPFADRVYPGAFAALKHLRAFGPTVILSDGDVVFQPRKVERSGLWDAVETRVLIYVHKELELDDVAKRYPADHYILVDDKIRLLSAIKQAWGDKLTSVFPRQGHYAHAPDVPNYPTPDVTVESIGELVDWDLPRLLAAAQSKKAAAP